MSENQSEHTAADRVSLLCRFAHACYIRSNNCVKQEEERKSVLNEGFAPVAQYSFDAFRVLLECVLSLMEL